MLLDRMGLAAAVVGCVDTLVYWDDWLQAWLEVG